MMDDMDVVVARPPGSIPLPQDGGAGEGRDEISHSGSSTVVNSDAGGNVKNNTGKGNNSNSNNTNNNNKEKISSPQLGGEREEKSDRKSRKKKERRKKDRKSGERRSKTDTIKLLEEENAKLKNEVEDLNLRLVHLEAREHNKELKLIHLQKELDETRSILIEKEGDCVEWEQIDREKDKTVVSLNQTIAILQRDLTLLLDEKDKDTEKIQKKQKKSIAFSPKPLEIFEYPREEDYESEIEGELTSDEYDEEDEGGERGEGEEGGERGEEAEGENADEEVADGDDEIIEKQVDETTPPLFLPFPVFSHIRTDDPPPVPAIDLNPLVKIFSPSVPSPNPDFESPAASPALSHHQPHTPPPPPAESPRNFFTSSNSFIASPHLYKPGSVSNSPPNIHHFFNPQRSNSESNLSAQSPRQTLPNSPSAPSLVPPGTSSSSESELSNVSVKELRTKWESPKGVLSPPLSRV